MDWSRLVEAWLDQLLAWLDGPNRTSLGRGRPPQRVTVVTVRPGPAPVVVGPAEVQLEHGEHQLEHDAAATAPVPIIVGPAMPMLIEPPSRAVWDERGWREQNENGRTVYEGAYQITRRSGVTMRFPGRIVVRNRDIVPYIADPPPAIKRHAKGPCFQLTQSPWFRVHWHKPARTVDDALLYVERVLSEVLP